MKNPLSQTQGQTQTSLSVSRFIYIHETLVNLTYVRISTGGSQLQSRSDSVTPWIVAHQASLSMGFSRQEHWSGLTFPSLGDLPNPGMEPISLSPAAWAGGFFTTSTTWEG